MRTLRQSTRRRPAEHGTQIMEFGLVALLFTPMILGSFVTGMNVIRSIQVNHMARDLANMYIHGGDFSDRAMQRIAVKLATGLQLQVGSATGNVADNLANSGRGIVWVSKLMYIGTDASVGRSASCTAVRALTPAGVCRNANKFVFVEHIRFGNGTLSSERDASVGHPGAGGTRDIFGRLTVDIVQTTDAAVPDPQQSKLQSTWQVSTGGRAPLEDKQVMYLVEVYTKSPDLGIARSVNGSGVYARWFF